MKSRVVSSSLLPFYVLSYPIGLVVRRVRALLVISLVALVIAGRPLSGMAQPTDPEAEARTRVAESFQAGDAQRLLTPAAERVEISILGMQTVYSRAQALYVLQDFFRNFTPQDFTFGDVSYTEDDFFATAQYRYGQAEQPLQAYVRLVRRDETWLLQEIRLDRTER